VTDLLAKSIELSIDFIVLQ